MNTSNTLDCIAWNTGRGYSAHGQRIAATMLEDGRIAFVDVDRHISGVTREAFMGRDETPVNRRRLQAFVMRDYDNCAYDDLASTFWMMSRGVESLALIKRLTEFAEVVVSSGIDVVYAVAPKATQSDAAATRKEMQETAAALAVLEDFNDLEQIDELYDDHPALASALATLIPGFEYPDWSHRSIADVRKAVQALNQHP